MNTNPLKRLEKLGQSIWLDYISRDLISSGQLDKLINDDGLSGITSNPNIFEKAIGDSNDYDSEIKKLATEGKQINEIYEALTVKDVSDAADHFRELFNKTNGQHGFVSLEVNPKLAYDTEGTIKEARRLWQALNRPNVFIKVPATKEGLPAITQLIAEGININVTLLFGLTRYKEVARAYILGIEQRLKADKPVKQIASVASFFLSRIDVLLDPILEQYSIENLSEANLAKQLQGQIAIACAKIAYHLFNEIFNESKFKQLAEQGAQPQKVLWASTSTKNPQYSDIKYVEALIGPTTVDTLPLETIEAYRDHGDPKLRLTDDLSQAVHYFHELPKLNIDMEQVSQQLEEEGVAKFATAYDKLISTLSQKVKG